MISYTHWSHADRKQAIVEELEARGVLFAALQEEVGSAFDPFDLVCHIAFDKPPLHPQGTGRCCQEARCIRPPRRPRPQSP
jgi:hypothetical protein